MTNSINTPNKGNSTMNDAIFALYPTINKSLAIKTQNADLHTT